MRIFKNLALLTVFMLTLGQAAFAGPHDFQLYNRSGVDIYRIFIGPSAEEDWGDDWMEGSVLLNGADMEMNFTPGDEIDLWDIMVEDKEGNQLYWREINLLETSEIILEPDEVARFK